MATDKLTILPIDRISAEGRMTIDNYAQVGCTAGRAAFTTGQIPRRTSLTTVGLPGAEQGIQPSDPTLAELIKPQGYRNSRIGKNHPAGEKLWTVLNSTARRHAN